MTSATRALAEFAASLKLADIPAGTRRMVQRLLLDTLGTALAGSGLGAGCREVVSAMTSLGGQGTSSVLGRPEKISAVNAAFANGALSHALNYDAIGPEVGHVGLATLAAPLAVAQMIGRVSGREFLAAATVAAEVASRLSAAQARTGKPASERFLAGQIFGYFGAAAGAGRLLGLSVEQMHSAFGIALMQASGTMQVVLGGDPPAKAIYGAFPNQGGVLAALLAREGLGAECDVFEGPAGVYAMFYAGEYQRDALTEELGKRFFLEGAQFKPWPTSGVLHPFIEAAMELARRGAPAHAIRTVQLRAHGNAAPWAEPIEERRHPRNVASAANSIPFNVAKALVHGNVSLRDFTAQGLADPAAHEVAERTSMTFDDDVTGAVVAVSMNDGTVVEAAVQRPLGHPTRPMSEERLAAKFRDCCAFAARPLTAAGADALIDFVQRLEETDDAGRLAALTCSPLEYSEVPS